MNNDMYNGLVKELYNARLESEKYNTEFRDYKRQFEESPEYVALKDKANTCAKRVDELEKQLKSGLIADQEYTPPNKAAWLINVTKVDIDQTAAMTWARTNMPVAITEVLDVKLVTKFAKENPGTASYATVTESKDARIATDLSKFVD